MRSRGGSVALDVSLRFVLAIRANGRVCILIQSSVAHAKTDLCTPAVLIMLPAGVPVSRHSHRIAIIFVHPELARFKSDRYCPPASASPTSMFACMCECMIAHLFLSEQLGVNADLFVLCQRARLFLSVALRS